MAITFSNQLDITRTVRRSTGREVYFDGADLVDAETSATVCANCFGRKTLADLIAAVSVYIS
jgi:hypothetical protein